MFNDLFNSLTPETKLKNYQEFNDPTNIFNKDVDISSFSNFGTDDIEEEIDTKYQNEEQNKLDAAKLKNEELLKNLQNQMQPANAYAPIVTDNNPFPYLRKPMIDLSKYDSDETAQSVLKEIDKSEYDASDKKYLKLLGARESDFRLTAGKGQYRGIYQFNKDSLAHVGIKMEDYLASPHVQFDAALRYRDSNVKALGDYQKYIGTMKDGVLVTKNGLGAMAHLLGASTVKDYFDGTKKTKLAQNGFKDGNGTYIGEYLKMFA